MLLARVCTACADGQRLVGVLAVIYLSMRCYSYDSHYIVHHIDNHIARRALLVGMAAAALAAQTSSVTGRLLIASGVGAVAPIVAFLEVLHLSMDAGAGFTRGNSLELFASLAAGASLIAGTL